MKAVVLLVVALAAFAAGVPTSAKIDIYKNTLLPNSRIVGGEDAEQYQFPYQCSLQWEFLGIPAHICGCSLLNENTALTAGHCKPYDFGTYSVVCGLLEQGEIDEDVQESDVDRDNFIVHPDYTGGVTPNDIAILKLTTPMTFTDAVKPVTLPSAADCDPNTIFVLSGWGLTSILPIPPTTLQFADLPGISNEQCAADLTALLGNAGPLTNDMVCTTANEGKKQSACSGDSGGPLVDTATGQQVGVVSWGITPCGTKGAPSVYTRICSFLDFIEEHL